MNPCQVVVIALLHMSGCNKKKFLFAHTPTNPPKKAVNFDVFIEFLKKKKVFYVFTKIQIPKPKFSSGFSHSVCISAAEDKDVKQLS